MSSKFQVYISCPMSVPQQRINDYAQEILKLGADVDFWVRNTNYNDLGLRRANAVVVLLESNSFSKPLHKIPPGTRKEIKLALSLNIPVYLGYRTMIGQNAIYQTEEMDSGDNYNDDYEEFEGVTGSSAEFSKAIKAWQDDQKEAKPAPVELKEPLRSDFKNAVDYIDAYHEFLNKKKFQEFNPFGPPVVDDGGKLAPCHSKSVKSFMDIPQENTDPIKIMNDGIYGTPQILQLEMINVWKETKVPLYGNTPFSILKN